MGVRALWTGMFDKGLTKACSCSITEMMRYRVGKNRLWGCNTDPHGPDFVSWLRRASGGCGGYEEAEALATFSSATGEAERVSGINIQNSTPPVPAMAARVRNAAP